MGWRGANAWTVKFWLVGKQEHGHRISQFPIASLSLQWSVLFMSINIPCRVHVQSSKKPEDHQIVVAGSMTRSR
jgi:hypothetical protein